MTSKPHSDPETCPTCGLHPYDFDVAEYEREVKRLQEQFEAADAFARVADAYCWDPKTTTHDDLMNARAAWQTQIGRMKLAARASSPAKRP